MPEPNIAAPRLLDAAHGRPERGKAGAPGVFPEGSDDGGKIGPGIEGQRKEPGETDGMV